MRAHIVSIVAAVALAACAAQPATPLVGHAPAGSGIEAIGMLCSNEQECKRAPVLVSLEATQRRAARALDRGQISVATAKEILALRQNALDALDRGTRARDEALINQARRLASEARAKLESKP